MAHMYCMTECDLAIITDGRGGRGKANGQDGGGKDSSELGHFVQCGSEEASASCWAFRWFPQYSG